MHIQKWFYVNPFSILGGMLRVWVLAGEDLQFTAYRFSALLEAPAA